MATHPFDVAHLSHYEDRLKNLTAESERKFGKMDSTNMLRHMRKSFESAVGVNSEDVKDISVPVIRESVLFLVTHVIKVWPGGALKAPRYWSPPAEREFDEELQLFHGSTSAFLEKLASTPDERNLHPVFGRMSVAQWALFLGPHLNHHLRQFGV